MTDQPDQVPGHVTEPIEPAAAAHPTPSRWERLRPKSRLSQVAAAVIAAAAAVFVAGAIFATGFALGSEGGGHHGHGGGEHSWQADHQNGGGEHHRHHGQDGDSGRDGDGG